ncbi:MAG: hypothetical protein M3072_13530 [Candidatus Dormibacteraeota bacterium]|nr:hypothetical protein [Candidatus Dormibacteraeota bacterium]
MTRKVFVEVELTDEQQRAIAWWLGGIEPEDVIGRIIRDQVTRALDRYREHLQPRPSSMALLR